MKNSYTILLFHSTDHRDLLSLKDLGNIHPDLFERLVRTLKSEFDIVGMTELLEFMSKDPGIKISGQKKSGIHESLMGLTFDDGPKSYALNAVPCLKALRIPSVCFLITDCIGDREIYWRYLYNYCLKSGQGEGLAQIISRHYETAVPADKLVSFTRSHFSSELNRKIIRSIFQETIAEEEYRASERELFLSPEDIGMLKKDPLVTFGIHTCSHPVMRFLDDQEILAEISGSLHYFTDTISNDTPLFSIPFGRLYKDYDERTIIAAQSLGIERIFSAYGGINAGRQPHYNIRRISVNEDMLRDGVGQFIKSLKDSSDVTGYNAAEKKLDDVISAKDRN